MCNGMPLILRLIGALCSEIDKGGYFLNLQLSSQIGKHYAIASCEAFVLHVYIHSEFHIMVKIGDTWSVKCLSELEFPSRLPVM